MFIQRRQCFSCVSDVIRRKKFKTDLYYYYLYCLMSTFRFVIERVLVLHYLQLLTKNEIIIIGENEIEHRCFIVVCNINLTKKAIDYVHKCCRKV